MILDDLDVPQAALEEMADCPLCGFEAKLVSAQGAGTLPWYKCTSSECKFTFTARDRASPPDFVDYVAMVKYYDHYLKNDEWDPRAPNSRPLPWQVRDRL